MAGPARTLAFGAVVVSLVLLTGGCGRRGPAVSAPTPTSVVDLGVRLPPSGIMVARDGGIVLYTLGGMKIGEWTDLRASRDSLDHRPGPRVVERGSRRFLLEGGGGRLRPFTRDVPLAYGFSLSRVLGPTGRTTGLELWRGSELVGTLGVADLRFVVSYDRDALTILVGGTMTVLDLSKGAARTPAPAACHLADDVYFVCGKYSGGQNPEGVRDRPPGPHVRTWDDTTERARLPGEHGHWDHVSLSPDGTFLVLQHSGECEIPSVYVMRTAAGPPTPLMDGAEAVHIGWAEDGRALVHFRTGACGSGIPSPGVYATDGERTDLVLKVSGEPTVWAPLP